MKRGACLAQLVEPVTLDLGVVSLSPTVGVEMPDYLKKKKQKPWDLWVAQWLSTCLWPRV